MNSRKTSAHPHLLVWISLVLCSLGSLDSARAADELPDAQAATEIIESLQGVLGDLSAVQALPPDQRIDWVRNQAAQRIKDKLVEDAKSELTSAMDAYAAAAFRAKAFEQIAVPAFKNASVTGGAVDWSLLEARMGSEVDARTRAYGTAITGLTIAWDSVDAFSNEGAQAGFSKLAAGVYEAVADAYIPGWGWFKLGVITVEALGNYVIGYATDTATEGMLEDIFEKSSNPQGFARMVGTVPLGELYAKVDDGWELVAYGRVWKGQGTEAGDEEMKQRLKDTVYDLKAALAHQEALQRQKDEALRAKFQPFLDSAAQAEAALRAAAAQVQAEAEPFLSQVRSFNGQISSLEAQRAEQEAGVYAAQAEPVAEDPLPYTPLNRAGVVSLYESAYAMVTAETGGSFSFEILSDQLMAANEFRWALVDGQSEPPDGPGKTEWLAHRSADRLALAREIDVVTHEANQRAAQLAETLLTQVTQLKARLRDAKTALEQGLAAIAREAEENLELRYTLQPYAWGDFTENWLLSNPFYFDYTGYWIEPAAHYSHLAAFFAQIQADRDALQNYHTLMSQLYALHDGVVADVDRLMREIIANECQDYQTYDGGSDELLFSWDMTNTYNINMTPIRFALPLTATVIKPELYANRFDSDRALTLISTRMNELQGDYDRAQLQKRLQQIVVLLNEKLSPFYFYRAADAGLLRRGRFNGILDYRRPVEETDLSLLIEDLQPVWDASQTRLALLGRHPDLVDPPAMDAILQYGVDLDTYLVLLDSDVQERAQAPANAAQLISSLQQALASLYPVLHYMNPEYYEETLAGLENTLKIAQLYQSRAKSGSSPVYVLLTADLEGFIEDLKLAIQETVAAQAMTLPTYSLVKPEITPETTTMEGAVGQNLQFTMQVDQPGGVFSSASLPSGLLIDPQTGAITGTPTETGNRSAQINYTAPSGITTAILVDLNLGDPPPSRQTIELSWGTASFTVQGTPGLRYHLQTKDGLDAHDRWVTVRTAVQGEKAIEWNDSNGVGLPQRFYRSVWAP